MRRSHSARAPWTVIRSDDKKRARIAADLRKAGQHAAVLCRLAHGRSHVADVVGAAGQLGGVHGRLEGAPQAEGRAPAEHAGVGARVLHGQCREAMAGPVPQPQGAALAGAAEAVGEEDQATRPGRVGEIQLEGQGARTAGVVNIAEAGEHPPGAGGAQVGQAAGGPTAQWAVHSTRPKCQVTSTTMPITSLK